MTRFALVSLFVAFFLVVAPGPVLGGKSVHEVLPGETLSAIAKRYRTSTSRIRKLNRLKSDRLRDGQKLTVVSPAPVPDRVRVRHWVRKGESLAQIARRHKMKLSLLRRLNPKVGSRLRPGVPLWVIRETQRGSRRQLHRLESGPGFEVLNSKRAFGTMLTVTRLADVLSALGTRHPERAPILVGDLSRERGGYLPPHRSHRRGRDVDLRYPLKRPSRTYRAATSRTLDVERTWELIQAFVRTGDVVYVFVDYKLQRILYRHALSQGLSKEQLAPLFQYPRSRRSMSGIIRHEPGHSTHLHIRFKAEPHGKSPNA